MRTVSLESGMLEVTITNASLLSEQAAQHQCEVSSLSSYDEYDADSDASDGMDDEEKRDGSIAAASDDSVVEQSEKTLPRHS